MKETTLSTCEKNFILKAALQQKRLDGRDLKEFRTLKVHFGVEWGLCYVSLGETRVLAQVTCEIQQPKATRPNEGLLFVNVELSSMAAPHFESGRSSDLSIHINRLLEKCIKDSKAVDLESLCVVAEEKVWALRVDVNVLNHEGSVVDCVSIATLAALAHFKRPDVTTDGEDIKVHAISERDPISITLHHYPVCVTFALLNNGENIFADPTTIEERVSEANLVFGVNAYRELCALHLGGSALAKPQLILKCSTIAAVRAKEVVDIIKTSLREDSEARQSGKAIGFVEYFDFDKTKSMSEDRLKIQLHKFTISSDEKPCEESKAMEVEHDIGDVARAEVVNLGDNSAELVPPVKSQSESVGLVPPPRKLLKKTHNGDLKEAGDADEDIGSGGPNKWDLDMDVKNFIVAPDSSPDHEEDEEIVVLPVAPKEIENIELSGDSEEEDVVVLRSTDIDNPKDVAGEKIASARSNTNFTSSSDKCQPLRPNKSKKNRKKRKK